MGVKTHMTNIKKVISFVLILCMTSASIYPSAVFAADDAVYVGDDTVIFNRTFDPAEDWHEPVDEVMDVSVSYADAIYPGAVLTYDVIITNQAFSGSIRPLSVLRFGDEWSWDQSGDIPELTESSFTDGKASVTAAFQVDKSGLRAISFKVAGTRSDYSGDISITNIRLTNGEPVSEPPADVESKTWTFDDNVDGWTINEDDRAYAYTGESSVSHDNSTFDSGVLCFNVDFSNDSAEGWSEAKMYSYFDPFDLTGHNQISYDFYYNPSLMTTGSFQSKVYFSDSASGNGQISKEGEQLANGFIKVPVVISFAASNTTADHLMLSIVGSNTDYQGPVYIDNVTIGQKEGDGAGVDITRTPEGQTPIDVNQLTVPSSVSVADTDATDETKNLLAYLSAVGLTDKVIFGHQNDTHHKAGGTFEGSTYSDSKDLTGSIAGVAGIDSLSLIGDEYPGKISSNDPLYDADPVIGSANVSIDAAAAGAIITLSTHMPNFSIIQSRGQQADGSWDFSGYSPNDLSGNVMQRILPGGDLNEIFTSYLDIIVRYALILQANDTPVLFRPFHENNGGWFWWGAAGCTPENYKAVYRYLVDYIKSKGVHNFLYVYSPNGPFSDTADYESRYPGDGYIDIIAFDYYQNGQSTEQDSKTWINGPFTDTVKLVDQIAQAHNKPGLVSETGIITGTTLGDGVNWGCIAETGNKNLTWFNDVLEVVSESNLSYMLAWADFDTGNFDMTYRIDETKGHEMANDFIDFYNDPRSIFADGTNLTEALSITPPSVAPDTSESGYILSPVDGVYLTDGITMIAAVKNSVSDVSFILSDENGRSLTIAAALSDSGYYEAILSEGQLSLFSGAGTVSLVSSGATLNTVHVVFGEKPVKPKGVVDDFELYNGNDAQLQAAWAANSGANCGNTITLTETEKEINDFGMKFSYFLSAPPEGYTGRTISYSEDVSEYNALRLWIKPDGKSQKLVVQVTSNGEDFEVDLRDFASTTGDKIVTIPFAAFAGKNNGTFDPSKVTKVGLWVNSIPPDDQSFFLESVIYFDNIHFVVSDVQEITYEDITSEDVTPPEEPVTPPRGGGYRTSPAAPPEAWVTEAPAYAIIIRLTIDSKTYTKNGVAYMNDVAPYISGDDRTMVPLRLISEGLGAIVDWEADTRTVIITLNGKTLRVVVDQPLPNNMGTAVIRNDRTFVPIRYISESLGATVTWDAQTKTVVVMQ
ncbi:MAG: CIA30 family protein [Clostridiales bacterium]|jgi:mannan endo-1,4-beta-mannosidase|nr:CIA30 family protein [Clostridiales bacterium]